MSGTIRRRGAKVRARVMIDGEEFSRTCDTEQQAHDFINAMIAEAAASERKYISLLDVGATWLDEREVSGLVKGIKKERSVWDRHIATWAKADYPIKKLSRKHLADFLDELKEREAVSPIRRKVEGRWVVEYRPQGRTLSRTVVKHVFRLIKHALRYAANKGHIKASPVGDLAVPKMERRPSKWTFLATEEIAQAFAGPYGPKMDPVKVRAILAIAIYAGLRKGEIWHLRWERVHLKSDDPRIEVREAKSEHGDRDVPIFPPVMKALREYQRSGGVVRARGLVFPSEHGGKHGDDFDGGWADQPYTAKLKSGEVKKVRPGIVTRVGISRPVRFHDLRHTFCSHLAMGTWGRAWKLEEIRDLAGHSSISVTQKYAHLCPGGLRDKARQMSAEWAETPERESSK